MKKAIWMAIVAGSLVACSPEDSTGDSNGGATGGDNNDANAVEVTLTLTTSSPTNSGTDSYPMSVKAEITGTIGSDYTLKLGNDVIETGTLPTVGAQQGGPFSGSEGDVNTRYVYFVVGEPGSKTVSVDITKDSGTGSANANASQRFTVQELCESNENFFVNESLAAELSFCSACHSQGGTASFTIEGSTYASIAATSKFSSNDPYVMAHMPADLDPTPEANGGELTHSGGVRWSQDSVTHFRMIELAYRVSNSFSAPNCQ